MGSGKTTLGRKLAARLNYEFMDLDHIFEAREGMTIAQYFAAHGEYAFRALESKLLKEASYPENAVVSTGGGLPCFFDNIQWMNAHGKTVYIKLAPKTLADRLKSERTVRPVLQGKQGEDLVAFIEQKLAEREKFYNQAGVITDGLSLTAEKAAQILSNA